MKKRNVPGVYLDVGGHIGNHAVRFATQCPATQLISIEPWEPARRVLETNLTDNAKVPWFVFPFVIGVEGEHVVHAEHLRGPNNQPLWLTRKAKLEDSPENVSVCRSIDSLVLEGSIPADVSLVKIDVDWWERPVLEGAVETFQEAKPLIALEVADGDSDLAKLMKLPALEGYRRVGKYCSTPTYVLEHSNA